jgi:glucoamylase
MPPQPVQRYIREKTVSPMIIWRFNHQIKVLPPTKTLRLETLAPTHLRWSIDEWQTSKEETSRDRGFGIHIIDLARDRLPEGKILRFTFYWPDAQRWEGTNFTVRLGSL